jgi:hypothetical protein
VVDRDGKAIALGGRRILPDAKLRDVRAKLADLDAEQLPTIAQAQERQRRAQEQEVKKRFGSGKDRAEADGVQTRDAADASSELSRMVIHEKHRRAHLELNMRVKEIEQAHARAEKELAKEQKRERQQLAERQRDHWWHKVIGKREAQLRKERQQRERQAKKQARKLAALENKKQIVADGV